MNAITKKMKEVLFDKPIYILLILLVIISSVFVPNFMTQRSISITLIQTCDLAIMACGLTFIIMNRGKKHLQ